MPLGTGNDLSRVLGWGAEHSSSTDAAEILNQILKAEPLPLDRYALSYLVFGTNDILVFLQMVRGN